MFVNQNNLLNRQLINHIQENNNKNINNNMTQSNPNENLQNSDLKQKLQEMTNLLIKTNQYLNEIILAIDPSLSFHDLRITNGENNINVIFDLLVPYEYSLEKIHETIDKIQNLLKEKDKRINLVCKIDHSFILDN